ncbi:hypothetical protein F5I97DRAFT_1897423 [Phlebopus sp. FC_14]|nr:hypothetical protein F5I97DRAFT_1897423 [Phlebopus sp. FC_14]
MSSDFPAIPGFYQALFLYFEPVSAAFPAFAIWFFPGAQWFHNQLVSTENPISGSLDARTTMALCQLGNCYMLLGLSSWLVFRAVRDALPNDPRAQERIVGAGLTSLALGDVMHIAGSWSALPDDIRYSVSSWDWMTHANTTFVIILLSIRLAWFAGIGRTRYYYGTLPQKAVKAA